MAVRIQITKFKFRQYQSRAISPNLMLAKVTPLYDMYNSFHYFVSQPAGDVCLMCLSILIPCGSMLIILSFLIYSVVSYHRTPPQARYGLC